MASKKITLKGGQLADTDTDMVGLVADDESGLYFEPDEDTEENQQAYSTLTHLANETNNPIWNQVQYNISDVSLSSEFEGHITLNGLKPDGTFNPIFDHVLSSSTASGLKYFDCLTSACTNDMITRTAGGSVGGAGTIDITMPLMYEKYENVTVMPSWYDSAWLYRMGLPIQKSLGKLHDATGRTDEYYGINISVPYTANMTDGNFTDIRFTANDGITELDFYVLNFTASTMASVIVMVPWWYIDKEREVLNTTALDSGGVYANPSPSYIYCYYGNAVATSASDITLGGNMYFYDDFADDDYSAKWTAGTPAGSSVSETGGYIELQVDASTAATPSVTSIDTGANFDGSNSFEVIWTIDEISLITGTAANQGPIFRVSTGTGDYIDCRMIYSTGSYGSGNAYHWRFFNRYTGNSAIQTTYIVDGATTSDRYLKLRYTSSSSVTGSGRITWYVSRDGTYWDVIGSNSRVTAASGGGGPITGDVYINMYHQGVATVGASQYVRVKNVVMYPIASNDQEWFEDHFTNKSVIDRWSTAGTTNSTFIEESTSGSGVTGTPGQLRLSFTNASAHNWTHTTQTCPIIYTTTKTTTTANHQEVCIYQAKIDEIGPATQNNFAGIFIAEGLTPGSHYALRWGVNRNAASAYTLRYEQQTTTATASVTMTKVPTLPCHVRIVLDPFNKLVCFDYSEDGIEWERLRKDANMYPKFPRYSFGTYMGLFCLATTTNSGAGIFDYFKAMTGLRESVDSLTWDTEEAYASYPLTTTAEDDDTLLSFTTATGHRRNNAIQVSYKEHGGDYNNSKILYITDDDLISIGPDGTDKYIGMQLEFDFNMGVADTFGVDEINFIYEVI